MDDPTDGSEEDLVCGSVDPLVQAAFTLIDRSAIDPAWEVRGPCTVRDPSDGLVLDCTHDEDGSTHVLEIAVPVGVLPLVAGDDVFVDAVEIGGCEQRSLELRLPDDTLLVHGTMRTEIPRAVELDTDLTLTLAVPAPGLCKGQVETCTSTERTAVELSLPDRTLRLYDGQSTILEIPDGPRVDVRLERAVRLLNWNSEDPECEGDCYGDAFRLLVVRGD